MAAKVSRIRLLIGWLISIIPAGMLIFAGTIKLLKSPMIVDDFSKMGYAEKTIVPIGLAEIACALIYLIPQTTVVGAILIAAFMGGATDASVRGGQNFALPVAIGILAWLGLLLREPRLAPLLPLRR